MIAIFDAMKGQEKEVKTNLESKDNKANQIRATYQKCKPPNRNEDHKPSQQTQRPQQQRGARGNQTGKQEDGKKNPPAKKKREN